MQEIPRRIRWLQGEIVVYPTYTCTVPYCGCSDLRFNDDGVWCLKHYEGAPPCSICGPSRPAIPREHPDESLLCRDCWQNTFGRIDISALHSALGAQSIEYHKLALKIEGKPVKEKKSKPLATKMCYDGPRGKVHCFAPGQSVCQCGEKRFGRYQHGPKGRYKRKNRKPRSHTPPPS